MALVCFPSLQTLREPGLTLVCTFCSDPARASERWEDAQLPSLPATQPRVTGRGIRRAPSFPPPHPAADTPMPSLEKGALSLSTFAQRVPGTRV